MPKELHEITKFTTGTITVPDEKDIPEDAASYSLNIDSVTEGGKLKGVPADFILQTSGVLSTTSSDQTFDAQVIAMINRDGYRDLVYFEDDTGKIHNITDVYRTGYIQAANIASVEGSANNDTITDAASGFLTSGFRAGQLIHVTGFSTSADNATYKLESAAAGTLTLTSDYDVTGDAGGGGETITITTYKTTDMGAARSANGWRTSVAGELGPSEEVAMQVHNKEVHIGMGQTSSDTPKWVGYVDHELFDTRTDTMVMEDAELKAPGSFPELYSAVTVGSYVYGIQWGGTRIYRFSTSDNDFDSPSNTVFTSTQGLSLVAAGDDIWVFDDNASFGTIYKIDVSKWGTADEISQTNSILGFGSAGTAQSSGWEISDLYDDGTVMWVALWKSGIVNGDGDGDFLYNATLETDNDGYTLTNRTPTISDESAVIGEFLAESDFYLYKQCLVGGTFSGVGLMGWLNDTSACVQTDDGEDGQGIIIQKGLIMWSVQRTYTARAAYSMGTGSLSGTTNCQIHEMINDGGDAFSVYGTGAFFQDGTKFMAAKLASANSVTLMIGVDEEQVAVAAGATTSAHESPISTTNKTSIELDGMSFAVKSDRTAIYGFEQDSGGGFLTIAYDDSTISNPVYRERSDLRVSFSSSDQGVGTFSSSDTYFWKFAYMYDEYQESPLSFSFSNTPTNNKNIKLTVDLYQTSSISKRASHLMVYRSQKTGETGAPTPDAFYRLIQKIPLANRFSLVSNGWGSSVDFRQTIFVDIKANIGASYEARTLMPETLESSMVHYSLSTQINSMHIVGKCYKADIPDAKNYLFKSKVNNFDQFDWTTDFLRLPTVPTALASFNGRIYAFDENNTYRINPNGFYIEDTFEGVGCSGAFAVAVTEYGMCYCDKNNIYLHDGKTPKPIGTSILTGSDLSWHNVTEPPYGHRVMFDSKRKSFMIFFEGISYRGTHTAADHSTIMTDSAASFVVDALIGATINNTTDGSSGVITDNDATTVTVSSLSGGSDNSWDTLDDDAYTITDISYAWSYNVPHNRWDLIHFKNGDSPEGTLHGKNGELFISAGAKLYHHLGSTSASLDAWEWRSKYMTMGEDTVKKVLYDVKVVGDGTAPTTTYGVNGDTTPFTSLSSGKIATADKKSKSLQLKIAQASGSTHKVDSVGVLYRRLPKTSGNI